MTQSPMTLWQTIDALVQQIPFTQENVERVLGTTLFDTDPTKLIIRPTSSRFLDSEPVALANGVIVEIDLRVRPNQAGHPGFLVLNVTGNCVRLDAVRAHYHDVRITATPRAPSAFHSLDEVTSRSTMQPRGKLSFSFAERNRECLSSIAFKPFEREAANAAPRT